jgi:hypothetical protein
MLKASANTERVRIGLARLVDCEHGSRMDLFALAPTTYLVRQVGYNIMPVMYIYKNEQYQSIIVCTINDARETNPFFLFFLCRLKINQMMRYHLCVYSWIGCCCEHYLGPDNDHYHTTWSGVAKFAGAHDWVCQISMFVCKEKSSLKV